MYFIFILTHIVFNQNELMDRISLHKQNKMQYGKSIFIFRTAIITN
jgi:hypothetical protein